MTFHTKKGPNIFFDQKRGRWVFFKEGRNFFQLYKGAKSFFGKDGAKTFFDKLFPKRGLNLYRSRVYHTSMNTPEAPVILLTIKDNRPCFLPGCDKICITFYWNMEWPGFFQDLLTTKSISRSHKPILTFPEKICPLPIMGDWLEKYENRENNNDK